MELRTYLRQVPRDERDDFAKRCKTSWNHLRNVAYGKRAGEDLCLNIERATDGAVRCEELRPDVDWEVLLLRGSRSRSL